MNDLLPKLVTAATCTCGAMKLNAAHLACSACMDKVPAPIRDRFFILARTKRGSSSYHCARRDVLDAVRANVEEAKKARQVHA